MNFWNYIVLSLSLLLWIVLLLWEIRRANKARMAGRIIAATLLVAALAGLALPVTYTSRSTAERKEGVLLTEGYDPDSARVYLSSGVEVKDLKDIHLSTLHILGYGLTEDERAALPGIPVLFHPSPMRTGIVSLSWRQQLLPGELFRIQGSCYNAADAPVKLLLFGINALLDSAVIRSQEGDFELRTIPLQAGRAVYKLMAVSGKDTLEQESIPVEVLPGRDLKILMLAASPDFENRFLARWLSDKGHGVIVRTAISKDKYDHAYLNASAMAVDHLSPSLLDKFDVVIADAAELKAIGPTQNDYLWHAIAEKGLGLVIKADSTSKIGERSLLRDSLNHTLISESMHGAGKIILTRLSTTYARLLAGERKEYSSLWAHILQQVARGKDVGERWQVSPALAQTDHPIKMLLQSAVSLPQGLLDGKDTDAPTSVYMAQDPLLPFCWEGTYWPRESGWQVAHTPEGERSWWYVWKDGDWKNIHRRERLEGTQQWIAARGERRGPSAEEKEAPDVLVAKGWFYVLFVLSGLFLWVERKI